MAKVIEGKNLVMVEEKAKNGTKIRKAKPSDVKNVPTKDKPRIAKKLREQNEAGFRESSIKGTKRLD